MIILINDHEVECKAGNSLLKGLLAAGFTIPTLCHHPALGADGRCGLCLVEVSLNGRWTPRLSCQVMPQPGMQVRTDTERIKRMRALSAQLLLRHAPFKKPEVQTLLEEIVLQGEPDASQTAASIDQKLIESPAVEPVYLVETLPIDAESLAGSGCILCGLCVRACAKTGRGALGFSGKGYDLRIVSWSGSADCGRCGACISVCPTGYLDPETKNKILIEW